MAVVVAAAVDVVVVAAALDDDVDVVVVVVVVVVVSFKDSFLLLFIENSISVSSEIEIKGICGTLTSVCVHMIQTFTCI